MWSDMTTRSGEARCPCGRRLRDHPIQDIASAVVNSPEDSQLDSLVSESHWEEAHRYQAWNATADIRAWRVLLCESGCLRLMPVIMTFEIWSDDEYGELRLVPCEHAQCLRDLVGEDWCEWYGL